jgi:hypothetical protein
MTYNFCLQTGQVFWGVRTPFAGAVPRSLYIAMLRAGADRRTLYRLRAFFV